MFFWTFWYIICIFLVWNEWDMIFLNFVYFLEFLNNKQYPFVPRLKLATQADRWARVEVSCHFGNWLSQNIDWLFWITEGIFLTKPNATLATDWWGTVQSDATQTLTSQNVDWALNHRRRVNRRRRPRSEVPGGLLWGWSEPEDMEELLGSGGVTKWLLELPLTNLTAVTDDDRTRDRAIHEASSRKNAPRIQRLTTRLTRCSVKWHMVGDDGLVENSGDIPAKGTTKYSRLQPPLDAKLLPDDWEGEAILPDLLLGL
jgi:hypothetical protein